MSLIAVILTKNEAHHVADCVASLRAWTDAVVVWDSGSEDGTQDRARAAGALLVQRPFDDYAHQRQAVLDSLDAEWILFIDADERATPELATEIQSAIRDPQFAGYWIRAVTSSWATRSATAASAPTTNCASSAAPTPATT
ncbi:MAG: glycosyltransferase family 2 protein [Caldilineaceae bacterium]